MKNSLAILTGLFIVCVSFSVALASSTDGEDVHYGEIFAKIRRAGHLHQISNTQRKALLDRVIQVRNQEDEFLKEDGPGGLTQDQINQLNSSLSSIF
jgi:hypothetical protein